MYTLTVTVSPTHHLSWFFRHADDFEVAAMAARPLVAAGRTYDLAAVQCLLSTVGSAVDLDAHPESMGVYVWSDPTDAPEVVGQPIFAARAAMAQAAHA